MLRRGWLGQLVVASLVVTGCAGSGTAETVTTEPPIASTTDNPVTRPSSETTPATDPPLVFDSVEFRGDLPRTVGYKGLQWSVTGARISNQDHGPIAEVGDPTEDYSVTVDVEVASLFGETLVRFDLAHLFGLDLGNGDIVEPMSGIETDLSPNDSAGPGESGTIAVHFPADVSTDLSQASLIIGEPGLRTTTVPFAGPVPDSGYPVELAVEVTEDIVLEAGCFTDPARLEILGGRLDIDVTVDEDDVLNVDPDTGSVTPVPRRAPIGARFVELDIRISTEAAGACGGSLVTADDFLIEVDGALRSHDWDRGIFASEALKSGEAIEFGAGYTIPVDLETLVLLAGYRGGSPIRIEIPLPSEQQ